MKEHSDDSVTGSRRAWQTSDARVREQSIFDLPEGASQGDTAATLGTVADTVRRIMRADTSSIATFSLADRTITWRAMSGFQTLGDTAGEVVNPLRGEFAERAAEATETIIEVRGLAGDLPVSEFPLHSAEGVRDLSLVPLKARGETLGVLAVGYRAPHLLTPDERRQLEGLAEMAALALDNTRLLETIGIAKRVWEQTFDAIPDGIIVHDDRMRIMRCNYAAAELMGMIRPAKVIGLSCAEAFSLLFGKRAAAYHINARRERTISSFELQAEDGRRYLVSIAPLTNLGAGAEANKLFDAHTGPQTNTEAAAHSDSQSLDSGSSIADPFWSVITWSDITMLSEVQEQLARTRRLATVGQLAAGVAHEINNPLAAITTCAEATLRALHAAPEAATPNVDYYLEEIVRQALRCKDITRGLLDLSRQRRARRETLDLNALVKESVRIFDERGRERGVAFSFEPELAVSEVATDEAMVRQILDNLLGNALDVASVGVRAAIALDGQRVVVEVSDDGPGIPPETLARVFDPFFTTKDPGHGSGLGLAISLTLAEALGGALTVESKSGAGTRFRLWLPRHAPEQN